MEKKRKYNPIKLLLPIILVVSLFFASELLYWMNNSPQTLTGFYISANKNSKYELLKKLSPGVFDLIERKITAPILYYHLEFNARSEFKEKHCEPFCLEYEESKYLLSLFLRLRDEDKFSSLDAEELSDLLYWMATINIWHDEDQTLELLKESLELNPDEEKRKLFYEELMLVSKLSTDPNVREYFLQAINSDGIDVYRKVYLAKVADLIAKSGKQEQDIDEAILFSEKSIELNPWVVDYYLFLSNLYLEKRKERAAESRLRECVSHLSYDSKLCQEMLEILVR